MTNDGPATPQVLAALTITLTTDGRVSVTGPIHDKTLCYGLLGQAQDAIREFVAEQQKATSGLTVVRTPLNNGGGGV